MKNLNAVIAMLIGTAVFGGFCNAHTNPFDNAGHILGMVLFSVLAAVVAYAALDKNFRQKILK